MDDDKKVICSTFTRVGSTRLCLAVQKLLDLRYETLAMNHQIGQPLSGVECQTLLDKEGGYIYKTHNFTPRDVLPLIAKDRSIKVVTIWRNFYDTLTSLIFYVTRCRVKQKLSNESSIESFLSEFGELPDKAMLNLLIEARSKWVEKKALEWLRFRHTIVSPNYFTVRYEEFASDPHKVLLALAKFFDVTLLQDELNDINKAISLVAMRQKHNSVEGQNDSFVRAGVEGDHRNWMDEQSIARIRGIFEKYSEFKTYDSLPTQPIV